MESFYRTLKIELIYQRKYETRMEAKRDIFEYIEISYNRERLDYSLGYHSPEKYEKITGTLTKCPFYQGKSKEWVGAQKEFLAS